jgi:acyl-CoA synthetase (AMP-forming)/AMP-acid ligase II
MPAIEPSIPAVLEERAHTRIENPLGEIWVPGGNVAAGYRRKTQLSEQLFGARLVDSSADTPGKRWLRTGEIKDGLVVDGRHHYLDEIESTVQEITVGRVAALCVPNGHSEQLVTTALATSGDVRRSTCAEQYRLDRFDRLDVTV